MLSNFLNIHHDLPSYVIVPEREKIARRLIKVNFVPRKVNSSTRGKDRKGKSFQRDCTRGRGLYEIHHEINTKLRHKRFTEKLQDYPSAIFKIVQSHHARQQ